MVSTPSSAPPATPWMILIHWLNKEWTSCSLRWGLHVFSCCFYTATQKSPQILWSHWKNHALMNEKCLFSPPTFQRSFENFVKIRTARQTSPECNCPPGKTTFPANAVWTCGCLLVCEKLDLKPVCVPLRPQWVQQWMVSEQVVIFDFLIETVDSLAGWCW